MDEVAHPTRELAPPQRTGRAFAPRTLRTKLQLFAVALVLLPGLLVSLVAVLRARSALETAVGQQLGEVAHDMLDELSTAVVDERHTLRTWARQDVMHDLVIGDLDKRVTRFLRSLVDGGAPYVELSCVDLAGRVVASTDAAQIGRSVADDPGVRDALAGRESLAGPTPGPPATVDLTTPIPDPDGSGTVIGALRGRYSWTVALGLAARVRRTLLPHGITVDLAVFDAAGTMIGASWRDDVVPPPTALAAAIAAQLKPTRERGWTTRPRDGVLVGYDRADEARLGWLAIVLEPLSEAYRPVHEMQRRLILVLGAVLLVALGIAAYLAERMSRPLRALTHATHEIAHTGATPRPVQTASRDEIGALASSFNTMTAALHRAQEDLMTAAKFAFIGEVAAGVAHEVRTPLGILRSSAQMLGRALRSDPARASELAAMMIEEVDRLDRVVDGLLELARPHQPMMEATALDAVLGRALDFAAGQARDKAITLRRELAPALPAARCDPEQIYQVALNLLVNALQILPRGGTITVRTESAGADRVAFVVQDDGPGIAPELQERVFTPFFSGRTGGTGLGLALVQRVVQAHQGTVSLASAVGQGAAFRVELPRAETQP